MKKILVAEKFPLLLDSLCQGLTNLSFPSEIAGTTLHSKVLQQYIFESAPHLLLLDIEQSYPSANAFCKALNDKLPGIRIILSFSDVGNIDKKLNFSYGIRGIILKSATINEFLQSVESVCKEQTYIHSPVEREIINTRLFCQNSHKDPRKVKISKREMEVLDLIVKENTTNEIAKKLFITPCTAEAHRLHLIQKFGVRNTAGLVREAVLRQIV